MGFVCTLGILLIKCWEMMIFKRCLWRPRGLARLVFQMLMPYLNSTSRIGSTKWSTIRPMISSCWRVILPLLWTYISFNPFLRHLRSPSLTNCLDSLKLKMMGTLGTWTLISRFWMTKMMVMTNYRTSLYRGMNLKTLSWPSTGAPGTLGLSRGFRSMELSFWAWFRQRPSMIFLYDIILWDQRFSFLKIFTFFPHKIFFFIC